MNPTVAITFQRLCLACLGIVLLTQAGAWPQLYASVGTDVRGNDYYGPSGYRQMRGHPKRVGRTRHAADPQLAAQLWDVSEQLTGVVFDWG